MPQIPAQNPDKAENWETPQVSAQGMTGAENQLPQMPLTRKFGVYGSRSLIYGGELLSALLCQVWDYRSQRYNDKKEMRIIHNYKQSYMRMLEKAMSRSTTIQY